MKDISVYTCKDGRTRAYVKDTKNWFLTHV